MQSHVRWMRLPAALALAASAWVTGVAVAQDRYPSRPIEFIVPWGTGGGADQVARKLGQLLEPELKVSLPVINVPGATGQTGHAKLMSANPDGYTIEVMTGDTFALLAEANSKLKLSDFIPLGIVIQQESVRRGVPYPQWIGQASAGDWQRLGRDYLARTAHWRATRPRFTDKLPENWKHAGILRAMLPGATVIETRRDPLETAWSCFKQQFYSQPHFANTLADLGAYLRGCERAMEAWRARDPAQIHLHRYEDLQVDPEAGVRALLAECGLDFDPACLQFHAAQRSVRTASAAQVRQPLQRDTARAAAYGALLDPLRSALGSTTA
jgi:hypothetical protein